MNPPMTAKPSPQPPKNGGAAGAEQRPLKALNALSVSIIGGPGCGKTLILEETIRRLAANQRVAVISGDAPAVNNLDHVARHAARVVRVRAGDAHYLDARAVRDAVARLDAGAVDIVFVENVGSLTAPADDLGQDATVTVFSVAAGDDKAEKHADLVQAADAVILNKIDLLPVVPFDLERFRADVYRLNPSAKLFEISALTGSGAGPWIEWLRQQAVKDGSTCAEPSHWFG